MTANLMIAEGLYALLVTANKVGAISYGPFTDPLVGGSTDGNGRIALNENWKSTEHPPTFNYFFDGSLGWAVLEQSGTSSSGVQDSLLHEAMHRAQALGWGKHGFGIGVFQDRVLHPFTPENRETEAPAYAIQNWFLYPGSCVGPE